MQNRYDDDDDNDDDDDGDNYDDDDANRLELREEHFSYALELSFPPEGSSVTVGTTAASAAATSGGKRTSSRVFSGRGGRSGSSLSGSPPGMSGPAGSLVGQVAPRMDTPPHKLPYAFKFQDYMSIPFRAVRSLAGIEEADYITSVAGAI